MAPLSAAVKASASPLPLAVAHQAGAFILFSLGLYALHGVAVQRTSHP